MAELLVEGDRDADGECDVADAAGVGMVTTCGGPASCGSGGAVVVAALDCGAAGRLAAAPVPLPVAHPARITQLTTATAAPRPRPGSENCPRLAVIPRMRDSPK